jgi:hypothetical protein
MLNRENARPRAFEVTFRQLAKVNLLSRGSVPSGSRGDLRALPCSVLPIALGRLRLVQ